MTELIILIVALGAYLLPIGMILSSKRTWGHEKNGWLIGTLIFSWVALLLYYSIVPKEGMYTEPEKKSKPRDFD
jgi:riboflavin transporter FmnP